MTLHDLVFDQKPAPQGVGELWHPGGPSIVAEIAEPVLTVLRPGAAAPCRQCSDNSRPRGPITSLKDIPDLDARHARTTPEELAAQVEKLNELYRGLLGVAGAPFRNAPQVNRTSAFAGNRRSAHARHSRHWLSDFTAFTRPLARSKARTRVAEGLVAVRRWQLGHRGEHRRRWKPPRKRRDCRQERRSIRTTAADPLCDRRRPGDGLFRGAGWSGRRREDR